MSPVLDRVRKVETWPLLDASPGENFPYKVKENPAPSFEWQSMRDGEWMHIPDANSEKTDAQLNNGSSIQLRRVARTSGAKNSGAKNSVAKNSVGRNSGARNSGKGTPHQKGSREVFIKSPLDSTLFKF